MRNYLCPQCSANGHKKTAAERGGKEIRYVSGVSAVCRSLRGGGSGFGGSGGGSGLGFTLGVALALALSNAERTVQHLSLIHI